MINVLFVCVHNAGGERLRVASAGTDPEDHVSDVVIGSLAEIGVDWTGRTPTRLTRQAVEAADVVVALKPGLDLRQVDGVRYETWPLPDPADWDVDGVRPLREHLRERIESLASTPTPTTP